MPFTLWRNRQVEGEDTAEVKTGEVMVVSSGGSIQIGDYLFKRDDLLFAVGLSQADVDRLHKKGA